MKTVKICPYGPDAFLIEGTDGFSARSCAAVIDRLIGQGRLLGIREVQGAMNAVLVECESADVCAPAVAVLEHAFASAGPGEPEAGRLHRIPVIYDGEDLPEFAQRVGCSVEEVVTRHTAGAYEVQAMGFMPGFPYLGPLDPRLHLARRPSPRLRVPAGSVAVGGSHTGIYPGASPGGWWLLGRTPVVLLDPKRIEGPGSPEAFLLRVGDRVLFESRDP